MDGRKGRLRVGRGDPGVAGALNEIRTFLMTEPPNPINSLFWI